ncbi:cytochrome P450 [Armillaria gallica]|uniref:Cytochrome P450 n=1 Tax=Armillaria gallica TaxID=47427 RepID=A0A2H3CXH9_ARMGA|nr:cytochrome P450 [Armillaria gallica]
MVCSLSFRTFTLGGEDTTAAAIAWTLYELSRRHDYQAHVREEIRQGSADYDTTPLLNAAINETLRLHPIVYTFLRYAAEDDTIPFSEPVRTRTGEMWNEVPVQKGQMVMISAYTYNRYMAAAVLPEPILICADFQVYGVIMRTTGCQSGLSAWKEKPENRLVSTQIC